MNSPSPSLEYFGTLFGVAGRVAFVTGARQGIGRSLALALARAGANVVVTRQGFEDLEAIARELDEIGVEHLELELELTDTANIEEAVHTAEQRWGRLDIVVNNAGLSIRKDAIDFVADEWDAILDANLRGAFLVCQAAAREMGDRGGRIINVSSTFARVAVAQRAPYAASKAGLEHLTRVLAVEWAGRGITVNAIAPATIITEGRREMFADEDARKERIRQIPLARFGTPEDLVGAVLLLAGDAGSFITGATIVVDGGFTLGPAGAE